MSRTWRPLFAALALVMALLALNALAAAGEWAAYGARYDDGRPLGLYRPGPGRPQLLPGARLEGLLIRVSINTMGFRGPDLAAERPPNGLLVWCVGGSTTFDIYAPDDASTWPAQLAVALQASLPGRSVEVVNAGIPGEVLAGSLEDLVRWAPVVHPDYVIVYHGANDLRQASMALGTPRGPPRGEGFALIRVMRRFLPPSAGNPGSALGEDGRRHLRASLVEFIDTAIRLGVRPMLATHALRAAPDATGEALHEQMGEAAGLLSMTPEDALAAFATYNQLVSALAQERGLPLADVRGAVPAGADASKWWGDATHFRAPGSALAGQAVAAAIRADLAAPGPPAAPSVPTP